MADVKEILVQWDAGLSVSAIGRSLGYSRPTVRKYVEAAERVGLRRGERRRSEATWERLPQELGCGQRYDLLAQAARLAAQRCV